MNLIMREHNMDVNNDDKNAVLEDINLPSFTEPYNNINYHTTNDDVIIFSFHEEEDTADNDVENANSPDLIERTRHAADDLSLSSGNISIETPIFDIRQDDISIHDEESTHTYLNETDDDLTLHFNIAPSIDNVPIGSDKDATKINIPYALFKIKLSVSSMSAMLFFLRSIKHRWDIMKKLSRKLTRLLSQHRQSQFEKS